MSAARDSSKEAAADPAGKLKFFYAPGSRAASVLWLLEELGVPYDFETVAIRHAPESYRAIQPHKKVPAVSLDGTVVTERAAITLFLTEAFPGTKLAPLAGDPLRAEFISRLVYTDAVIDPAMTAKMSKFEYDPSRVSYGSFDDMVANLERILEAHDYAVGNGFTAADTQFGTAVHYGIHVGKVLPNQPVFQKYLERLMARPAFQRFMEIEQKRAKEAGLT